MSNKTCNIFIQLNNKTDSRSALTTTTLVLWSSSSIQTCEPWVFRPQVSSSDSSVKVLFIFSHRENREVQSALHTRILACWEKDITVTLKLNLKTLKCSGSDFHLHNISFKYTENPVRDGGILFLVSAVVSPSRCLQYQRDVVQSRLVDNVLES